MTIRTVADQVQLVVQIVLTTSSKTVSLRISLPAPRAAQVRSGSVREQRVELREVLVEPQDVAYAFEHAGAGARPLTTA